MGQLPPTSGSAEFCLAGNRVDRRTDDLLDFLAGLQEGLDWNVM